MNLAHIDRKHKANRCVPKKLSETIKKQHFLVNCKSLYTMGQKTWVFRKAKYEYLTLRSALYLADSIATYLLQKKRMFRILRDV